MKITRDKVVKRGIEFIALCYVIYLVGCVGFITTMTSLDSTGSLKRTESVNIIGIHQVISDYGTPTASDVEFFERAFDTRFANKTVMVNFTLKDCVLEGVYAYWRVIERKSANETDAAHLAFSYGDPESLLRLGQNTTVNFQIDERATGHNPFVLIIVVTPMGYNGGEDCFVFRGMITVRVMVGLV